MYFFFEGQLVGVIVACAWEKSTLGWVSLHGVHPAYRKQGIGAELLGWAENWLRQQGCNRIRLGGNLRPFFPGLPERFQESLAFYQKQGYSLPHDQPNEYDVARVLREDEPTLSLPGGCQLRPMQSGEQSVLLAFLEQEFPGRWAFEASEFLRTGGRLSDYLLLWCQGKVHGFARLTLEDSERPIERFYPQPLPRPWGQLGPLGISRSMRGQGLGRGLVDAALAHLKKLGVKGCVIDWTNLLDFYQKFGFAPFHQYFSLFKSL